jgi:hypothetical protein
VSGERLARGGAVRCGWRRVLFLPEERRLSDRDAQIVRSEADAFVPVRAETGGRYPARPIRVGRVAA